MHCLELVSYIIIPLKNPITIWAPQTSVRYIKSRSKPPPPRGTKRWNRCMQKSRVPRRLILLKRGERTTSSQKNHQWPKIQCRNAVFFCWNPYKQPKMNGFAWGEISTLKQKLNFSCTWDSPPEKRLIYGALDVLCWRWPQLFFGTKCPSKILRKKNTMMFLVCFFKQKYWS